MTHVRRHAARGALSGVLACAVVAAMAGPAAAEPVAPVVDFNGDGRQDIASGAVWATVGGQLDAGAVTVLYGASGGVSETRRTVVHQGSPGVPGAVEEGDYFGSALAAADLDGDGYTDLAVSAVGEDIAGAQDVGAVTVLWGGPAGLSGGTALWQSPALEELSYFGADVASGDFDGDGHIDVTATAWQGTHTWYGPFDRATGAATNVEEPFGSDWATFTGDLDGDGDAERFYPYPTEGNPDGIAYQDWEDGSAVTRTLDGAVGDAGAVGDVDGDGYDDLVLGDWIDGGRISVWHGGPEGPDPDQTPTVIDQDSPGVPGGTETDDGFGEFVSVADVNGDGYADAAVGTPGEDVGQAEDAGMVTVLYGSPSGLSGAGSQAFTQEVAGVPGAAETWDGFGVAVSLRDVTGDGRADLLAGVPGENLYGAVAYLRATATGVTGTGSVLISARDVGLEGYAGLGFSTDTGAARTGPYGDAAAARAS
ncbi:FG-GAP-like repeat-containing protein [Streptomyces avicenniae]|uniref:FG-GAP-like repeat-containing protein n=1 Tax=Streptomyces avicenniae TaxID=500153 RepID=UPI000DA627E2|nr:FG-GAP-like repeat-containing protein [Streptomyces avicenniae]